MEKDSQENKIHIGLPIIFSIFLGGAFWLSSMFLFLEVITSDSGAPENKIIATMVMLTPMSVLAGLIAVWGFWATRKIILMTVGFFIPIIWWALIMLVDWIIGP